MAGETGREVSGRLSALCGFYLCEVTAKHFLAGLGSLLLSRASIWEEEMDLEWEKQEQSGTHQHLSDYP